MHIPHRGRKDFEVILAQVVDFWEWKKNLITNDYEVGRIFMV